MFSWCSVALVEELCVLLHPEQGQASFAVLFTVLVVLLPSAAHSSDGMSVPDLYPTLEVWGD